MYDLQEIKIKISTEKYEELRKRIATRKNIALISVDMFDVENYVHNLVYALLQDRIEYM